MLWFLGFKRELWELFLRSTWKPPDFAENIQPFPDKSPFVILQPCQSTLEQREARTPVRNKRKYTPYNPTTAADSDFKQIKTLDKMCIEMSEQGRTIPWNGLRISLPCDCVASTGEGAIWLTSQLKVTHLEIIWNSHHVRTDIADCAVHRIIAELFRHSGQDLRKLQVTDLPPGFYNQIMSFPDFSGFPGLEEIEILNINSRFRHGQALLSQREMVWANCSPPCPIRKLSMPRTVCGPWTLFRMINMGCWTSSFSVGLTRTSIQCSKMS